MILFCTSPRKLRVAAFSPFNCRATLYLSAFISAMMSMCSSAGEDCIVDPATALSRDASAKFQRHDSATHQPVASLDPDSFIARAKGLVKRGFKPKDAADITAREIMFENHDDPDIARKCRLKHKASSAE